jgi:hypothetical protein
MSFSLRCSFRLRSRSYDPTRRLDKKERVGDRNRIKKEKRKEQRVKGRDHERTRQLPELKKSDLVSLTIGDIFTFFLKLQRGLRVQNCNGSRGPWESRS